MDKRPFVLSGCDIIFDEEFFIEVIIHDFQYLNPYSNERLWSFDKFVKEKIGRIRVHKKAGYIYDSDDSK